MKRNSIPFFFISTIAFFQPVVLDPRIKLTFHLFKTFARSKPGDIVLLEILRNEETIDIRVISRPSKAEVHATEMVINIEEDWGFFSAGINNQMLRNLGPWIGYANLTVNNLLDLNEEVSLITSKSLHQDKTRYLGLGYEMPLTPDGLKLKMKIENSIAKPSGGARSLALKSEKTVKYTIFTLSFFSNIS